jgi:predicted nucleotidyltransferase
LGYGNGTFATQNTFSTGPGSLPVPIAFGDFNSDNQSDIVVANSFTSNLGVFLVHYETEFTQITSLSTGSSPHPYAVAVGNFNTNNRLDMAVANSGNDCLQIFLDYNNGTFMDTITYPINFNSHPQYVIVADFNEDNRSDIATANHWNDSISVFVGLGNGTFNTANVYSTGSGSFPSSMAVGDFNNDNRTDIVVANQAANNVGVFLGFDHPMFSSYNIDFTRIFSFPVYVVTADFNNDSCWDIAVANPGSDTIGILLGYGNGTFSKIILYSVDQGSNSTSIAVGDFNNDHRLDIAVTNLEGYSVSVFLGYGDGTFAEQMVYSTNSYSPISIAIGDFNNDSRLDIVVANPYDNNIGISFGFGNGSFGEQMPYWMPNNSVPVCVAVDDFNNDRVFDIAIANRDGNSIGILLGYGDGTFSNVTTYSTGNNSSPCSMAIGDINKDKWMDIVVANRYAKTVGIFFGYGNGTFSSEKTYSMGNRSNLTSIAVGKINNDTILDIIVTDYASDDSYIGILYGLIDGSFAALQTYSTGSSSNPLSVVICDFNNDNRVDLAVANSNTDNIGIMLQGNTIPFGTQATFPTGDNSQPSSVAMGDFNNDNQLDIAVANSGTNNIGILLGYGNGSFTAQKTYSTGPYSRPTSITVSDFNNDKQLDFAVTNSDSNNIEIYCGYGNGSFAIVASYSTGQSSAPSSIDAADLNRDHYVDLVVTNWGTNNFLVFFGLGNGRFLDSRSYSVGYDARPQFVTIADFNNDSWLDIGIVNYGTNHVDIFLQTC